LEILKGSEHLGEVGIDGMVILKWILGMCELGSSGSGYGLGVGSFEH